MSLSIHRSTSLLVVGCVAMLALAAVGTISSTAAACSPTWTTQSAPNPGDYATMLQDVDASSSTDAWAVGSYETSSGQIRTFAERYDGTAWTQVKSPNVTGADNVFADVVDFSPTNAWAVGWGNSNQTLVEHWDGASWSVAPSPNPGTNGDYLTAVDASSPTDAWAVGWQQASSGLHS